MHHEESSTWNSATQKNSATLKKEQHEISATWKECNKEKVQHENSVTRTNYSDSVKSRKNCTRRVRKNA